MTKTMRKIKRLRKGRCTAILVVLILAMMLSKAMAVDMERPMTEIIVTQGDTLWNLVQEHYDYEGDIRKAIYEVRQLNGLEDANLTPGQILKIPGLIPSFTATSDNTYYVN